MQDNAILAQTYADAGFVFPVEGVPEAEAQACLAALEQFERTNDARIESAWRARLFELHLLLPEFDALVRSPPVLAAVKQILGPDLLVWECNILLSRSTRQTSPAARTCTQHECGDSKSSSIRTRRRS